MKYVIHLNDAINGDPDTKSIKISCSIKRSKKKIGAHNGNQNFLSNTTDEEDSASNLNYSTLILDNQRPLSEQRY